MSESPWLPSHWVFESSVFIFEIFGRRRDSELDRRTVGGTVGGAVGIRPVGGVGIGQSADDAAPEVQRRKRRLRDFVHIAGASRLFDGGFVDSVDVGEVGGNDESELLIEELLQAVSLPRRLLPPISSSFWVFVGRRKSLVAFTLLSWIDSVH